ncbi:hypothetical protein T484DRAFT_1979502 [Baffinella frigidus]|nr:hypothetical protein T484DRAFT_1979502 [Cryptophyta sp. CCMP2293]
MARSAVIVAALCVHGSLGAFLSAPHAGLSAVRGMHLCPAERPAWSESGRAALAAGAGGSSVLQWDASARGGLLGADSSNLVLRKRDSVLLGGVLRTQCSLVTEKLQPPRRRGGAGASGLSIPVIPTIPTPDVVTEDPVFVLRFQGRGQAKNMAEGRDVLRAALKKTPWNAILWQAWADLENTLNRSGVARKLYKKGLEANPRLPSLYNAWGSMEKDLGNLAAARRLFEEGLVQAPGSSRLLYSLGVFEDVHGNPSRARNLFVTGLSLEPRNAHLRHALAVSLYKAGDVPTAREELRRAVSYDPDHTKAWLLWAQMEEAEGNVDVARGIYSQSCKARGGRGDARLYQAWARLEEKGGDQKEALAIYERGGKAHPNDVHLVVQRAALEEKRGEVSAASRLYTRALAIDRYDPHVYRALARLHIGQLAFSAAREVFVEGERAVLARRAADLGVPGALAEGALQRRNPRVSVWKEGAAGEGMVREERGAGVAHAGASPDLGLAHLLAAWADLEWGRGDLDATRALFGRAVEAHSGQAWLWRSYAAFEAQEGDVYVARHCFARAVRADPAAGETWAEWGAVEKADGNEDRGSVYLRRAVELFTRRDFASGNVDRESPLRRPWSSKAGAFTGSGKPGRIDQYVYDAARGSV